MSGDRIDHAATEALVFSESERLSTLHQLNILDTPPEERFDRITRLTKAFFQVPIVVISLVDEERSWFKSHDGLDACESPRSISFCNHALRRAEPLVVEDALSDPRFRDNPQVTESPHIRFYAGHPLHAHNGATLGFLCLIDSVPRRLESADAATLADFAGLVEAELNWLHRHRDAEVVKSHLRQEVDHLQGSVSAHSEQAQTAIRQNAILVVERQSDHHRAEANAELARTVLSAKQQEVANANEELGHQQAALARQNDLLSLIIESSPTLIAFIDTDCRYQLVNETMLRTTERTRDEVIGQRVEDLLPAAWADVGPRMRHVLATGEASYAPGQLVRHLRGGKLVDTYWDLNYMPMRAADGATVGLLAISHEVTQHVRAKQLEEEKVQLLESSEQAKDQFLGILSHELRTPLNAIQGFGSALEDGLVGDLTTDQGGMLGKIMIASDHLLALVDDLLDLSRMQAGKFTLVLDTTPLLPLVQAALASAAPGANLKAQTLDVQLPNDLPALQADPQRVVQILDNLLKNAVKYTPRHGTITVRAFDGGDHARLEISDTGIGIAPEEQDRIFQAFTQVDMTATRVSGGVGLGLSIVKALVEAHGGQVGVRSVPGEGSTFWVTLPRA